MSYEQHKEELFTLIQTLSFQKGDFLLASGKRSKYYIDCRKTTLSARGAYLIGHLLYEKIRPLHIDAVGGMSMGADPIVTAISYRSAEVGQSVEGFLIRKEAKGHGMGRQVEGHLKPWMRVVLVEDVVTTGSSTIKAIQAVKTTCPSARIVQIVSLVDRESGGKEAFTQLGIPYQSLYSVREFLQE